MQRNFCEEDPAKNREDDVERNQEKSEFEKTSAHVAEEVYVAEAKMFEF